MECWSWNKWTHAPTPNAGSLTVHPQFYPIIPRLTAICVADHLLKPSPPLLESPSPTYTQIPTHPVIIALNSVSHSLGLCQPSLPEKLVGQLNRYESLISLHFPSFPKLILWSHCPCYSRLPVVTTRLPLSSFPGRLTDPSRHLAFFSPVETFKTSTSLVHP